MEGLREMGETKVETGLWMLKEVISGNFFCLDILEVWLSEVKICQGPFCPSKTNFRK